MELCFATNNEHKIEEILAIVGQEFTIHAMSYYGFHDDIPEPGATLEENSLIKAQTIFRKIGIPVLADDSGLEVTALNNEPGVYSARYAGDQKSHKDNNALLLRNLSSHTDRSARFRTVITYMDSDHQEQFEGIVEGEIIKDQRGFGGFGYDPLFVPSGFSNTFAEMSFDDKNKLSHRARAFQKLAAYLNGR